MRKDNNRNRKGQNQKVVREQPKKDSKDKRINMDNERVSKFEKDSKCEEKHPNDVSWYSSNPELLKAAGSLPFASTLGVPLQGDGQTIPGILAITWEPIVGGENGVPINQCFNSMYSYIVHANSRNYKYDPADLGMLVIAGGQVFSIIAAIARAYGIIKYYQERNDYFPDNMLRALGFNAVDFRAHLGDIWFRLNDLIDQTRQIWTPNTFPMFDRWIWLNSFIFTDAVGVQSQSYVYVQNKYYVYDQQVFNTGGALRPVLADVNVAFTPGNAQYDVATWFKVAQFMIDQLMNSQDRGMIFGDILNAYGADRIRSMSQIPSDYIVAPVYNEEVLVQIENTVPTRLHSDGIAQFGGKIVQLYETIPNGTKIMGHYGKAIMNFHFPAQPAPEQIMVASRMMSYGYVFGAYYNNNGTVTYGQYHLNLQAAGSEICHDFYMYMGRTSRYGLWSSIDYNDEEISILEAWLHASAFDWHPFFYTMLDPLIVDPDSGNFTGNGRLQDNFRTCFGDYDNYLVVEPVDIAKLHRVALYSLWGVPHI